MITFTEESTQKSTGTDPEQFHIDSESAANWLLRRLANIEAEKERVKAQAAAIVAQLEGDAQRLRHLYEGELLNFCRQRLADAGSRRRTLTLLQGSISFRSVPASIKVTDQATALQHAQTTAPNLVRSVVTLDAAGYRDRAAQHLAETGELLPGVETTPAHEAHRLSFGKLE